MYSVYKYNNGATAANVLADVVAILTGTTDVQTLSASCDKAATSILTSINQAGWLVHDTAPGTANTTVLKAPVSDDPSRFKYLWLSTNTVGALYIVFYEIWNSTSHTGTNMAPNDSSSYQRVSFSHATGGFLHISASANHAAFHSYSSGGTIGSVSTTGLSGIFEHSRWDPWDTVANGYIPAVSFSYGGFWNGMYCHTPRYRGSSGTDVLGGGLQCCTIVFSSSGGYYAPTNNKTTDAQGALMVPILPLFISGTHNNGVNWRIGGNVSEKSDIWLLPSNAGGHLDEVTVSGGRTYVIWQASNQTLGSLTRVAVPKG